MAGTIPHCIGNLSNLEYLELGASQIEGTIPPQIGNLTNLGILGIELTLIKGHIPTTFGHLNNLVGLGLSSNFLSGSIPTNLFSNMNNLNELSLANNFLRGTIPDDLYRLSYLTQLDMSSNYFEGQLSNSLGELSSLKILFLYSNYLSGSLPRSIGNLSMLRVLRIEDNFFTNSIPEEYCNMRNLELVYLFANFFSGSFPFKFFDFPFLTNLIVSSNRFSQTLPPYANAPLLEGLDMSLNLISGQLNVFEALPSMTVLLVNGNSVSGTLPTVAEQYITNLIYLNLSSNFIGGEVPNNLLYLRSMRIFDVSNNYISGSSPSMFHNWTAVYNIYLNSNLFSGDASHLFDINEQVRLGLIDISSNGFGGTIPTSWFQLPNLHSLGASENCFTGSIPTKICTCTNLTFLILDGLHSSSLCRKNLFFSYIPGLASSSKDIYYLSSSISEGIPSCIFNLSFLQTLHVSGNGIRGSLAADLAVGPVLTDLTLSHNDLTGLLPSHLALHHWESLDISFNKFRGTISEELSVQNRLDMQVNRFSGSIPAAVLSIPRVNILSGNMFACQFDGNDLPRNDPSYNTYTCGSDEVNIALEIWLILLTIVAVVIIGTVYRRYVCSRNGVIENSFAESSSTSIENGELADDSRHGASSLSSPTIASVWDNMLKWISMTGIYHVTWKVSSTLSAELAERRFPRTVEPEIGNKQAGQLHNSSMAMISAGDLSKANHVAKFVYITGRFHRYLLIILLLMMVILMPVYLVLTISFGTYTFQYAWTLSACFLQGVTPAIIMFVLFLGTLVVSLLMLRSRSLLTQRHPHSQYHAKQATTAKNSSLSWEDRWNTLIAPILIYAGIAIVNFVVVLAVNAAYVFSVGAYSFGTVFAITLIVSAFKLVWNNVVVINLVGQYTQNMLRVSVAAATLANPNHEDRHRHQVPASNSQQYHIFSPSTGNFLFLILLPLFNNIFAPYIAEAFVSSNCFLYAISSPDAVASSIKNPWGCEVDDDFSPNGTQGFNTNCGPSVIMPPQSNALGFTNVTSLSYNPPFLYSYQCSSSLITAFAFVFAYRYIFTGIVQPLLFLGIKYSQEKRFRLLQSLHRRIFVRSTSKKQLDLTLHLWTMIVPPLAKFLLPATAASTHSFEATEKYNKELLEFNDYIASLLLQKSCSFASYLSSSSNPEELITEDPEDYEEEVKGGQEGNQVCQHQYHADRNESPENSSQKSTASIGSEEQKISNSKRAEDPYKITRAGFIGKAFALRMISDLTVLLTFGVIFPPLSPLIVWSMFVESYLLIVSLGRYLDVLLRSMTFQTSDVDSSVDFSQIRQSTLWRMSSTTLATAAEALQVSSLPVISLPPNTNNNSTENPIAVQQSWTQSQLWADKKALTDENLGEKNEAPPRSEGGNARDTTNVASLWSLWLLLNDSFRTFRRDLRRGIDISFIFASVFWSFSLLDTVGNGHKSESPDVIAFILLVIMCTAPFWVSLVLSYLLPWFIAPQKPLVSAPLPKDTETGSNNEKSSATSEPPVSFSFRNTLSANARISLAAVTALITDYDDDNFRTTNVSIRNSEMEMTVFS